MWRQDLAAFGDCFTTDCQWVTTSSVLNGRAGILEGMGAMLGRFIRMFVRVGNAAIAIEKDGTILSKAFLTEQATFKDGSTYGAIGIYHERFVNQGDRLRVKWRMSQLQYSGPPDMSGTHADFPQWGLPPDMPPIDVKPPKA
jgi:hypothetical protein